MSENLGSARLTDQANAGRAPPREALPSSTRFPGRRMLGVRVDDVPPQALVAEMARSMAGRERLLVLHVNAWLLTLARTRPWLRDWFLRADVVYADGVGAQWAAIALTGKRPRRSTAPEWIEDLGRLMAAQGSSIYWLGSQEDVIVKAAANFAASTGARIAGWHHGFFDQTPGSAENQAVVEAINRSGSDFLVVNMGMPAQERWLHDNWDRLDVTVALVAGAMADRVAGQVARPPAWVSNAGLEWLTRLVVEPRRLWRRYLFGLPVLAGQVAVELVTKGPGRLANARRRTRAIPHLKEP